MSKCKTSKNSLIELMRFLFALWVLYYHHYVPYKCDLFSDGYLAVEFFFVLSGFFLVRSIDKYTSMPAREGFFGFLKHRFMTIALPFVIGEVFVFAYVFLFGIPEYNILFGYLWYIRDLFIAMAVIFLLRRIIKRDFWFYALLLCMSITAMFAFSRIPLLAWPGGPFRSIAAMPLGMLAAIIPKLSLKKRDGEQNKSATYLLAALGLLLVAAACIYVIVLPQKSMLLKCLLVMAGYPLLLYFASCVKFNCKLFDWLGSLSFPIYAFQCIIRVIEGLGLRNNTYLFIILMLIVLTFSAITHLCKKKREKSVKI